MADLGYDRYGAQGGDWGSIVSRERRRPRPRARVRTAPQLRHRAAARRTSPDSPPTSRRELRRGERVPHDRRRLPGDPGHEAADRSATGSRTRPPGCAAWIVEKFRAWTDCDGDVERVVHQGPAAHQHHRRTGSRATATSSARLYYEMRQAGRGALPQEYVDVPTGIANFPGEVTRTPRSWVEHRYNVTHWTEQPAAGTSRPCRCPTSSSTTSGRSSAPSAEPPPPNPRAACTPLYNVITSRRNRLPGGSA